MGSGCGAGGKDRDRRRPALSRCDPRPLCAPRVARTILRWSEAKGRHDAAHERGAQHARAVLSATTSTNVGGRGREGNVFRAQSPLDVTQRPRSVGLERDAGIRVPCTAPRTARCRGDRWRGADRWAKAGSRRSPDGYAERRSDESWPGSVLRISPTAGPGRSVCWGRAVCPHTTPSPPDLTRCLPPRTRAAAVRRRRGTAAPDGAHAPADVGVAADDEHASPRHAWHIVAVSPGSTRHDPLRRACAAAVHGGLTATRICTPFGVRRSATAAARSRAARANRTIRGGSLATLPVSHQRRTLVSGIWRQP